uniref:Cytochrome c oxidase subunit 3 n=1 Tax=Bitectipora retepora TaxID=2138262 RepID=A0A2R4K2W2_9BILA|nr:cytochrome c oxidase subunit III [Bitectipora retepora]
MQLKMYRINPFHLVDMSPWPIYGSMGALCLTSGLVSWMHHNKTDLMLMGLLIVILTMLHWWRDVIRESTFMGMHTKKTMQGLRLGVILFIVSEVCFFFAFFWSFFHSSLAPTIEVGNIWPPKGVNPLNPWGAPLLNTVLLLSSGVTVTCAHHSLLAGFYTDTQLSLLFTVLLGLDFTIVQYAEYLETSFSITDSVYGTTFFVATGFHGLHVIIGSIFLIVCFFRHMLLHFNTSHHLGFEAAAWYWHFVDVVWLFLFISIYWWGS